jgi:hypothetical protein
MRNSPASQLATEEKMNRQQNFDQTLDSQIQGMVGHILGNPIEAQHRFATGQSSARATLGSAIGSAVTEATATPARGRPRGKKKRARSTTTTSATGATVHKLTPAQRRTAGQKPGRRAAAS